MKFIENWPYSSLGLVIIIFYIVGISSFFYIPQFGEVFRSIFEFNQSNVNFYFWLRAGVNTVIFSSFVIFIFLSTSQAASSILKNMPFGFANFRSVVVLIPILTAAIIPLSLYISYLNMNRFDSIELFFRDANSIDVFFHISIALSIIFITLLSIVDVKFKDKIVVLYRIFLYCSISVFFASVILEYVLSVYWALWLGPIPIILIFSMVLLATIGLLFVEIEKTLKISLKLLAIYALGLAFIVIYKEYSSLLNRNHASQDAAASLRQSPKSLIIEDTNISEKELQDGYVRLPLVFPRWVSSLKDSTSIKTKKQKVIIASVQGGGLFSAFYAAYLLASIQDKCPRFRFHLFAISGVSGGTLGGAVFSGSTKLFSNLESNIGEIPSYKDVVEEFFDNDFLTPIVATFLYDDLFSGIVPFSTNDDRGVTFRKSLRIAWENTFNTLSERNNVRDVDLQYDFWDLPIDKSWSRSPGIPALIFNVTVANDGHPMAIAPFPIDSPEDWSRQYTLTRRGYDTRDQSILDRPIKDYATEKYPALSVGEATLMSASFPLVTPTYWIRESMKRDNEESYLTKKFVDGGYSDNSGSFAAGKLLRKLAGNARDIDFTFLKIDIDTTDNPTRSAVPDLILPLQTLYGVRSFHQRSIGLEIDREFMRKLPNINIINASLRLKDDFLLSWQLSKAAKERIKYGVRYIMQKNSIRKFLGNLGCQ